ncbi:Ent-kaurene oxidase-like protein [Paramyrothecium foliicola]|nr:Ent-kaurene oxidase-like protein [Paramyrothecium foliicola]
MVVNAVYYLAAYPALVDMLREDVQTAISETNGQFTHISLASMKKLDSFLKEVTRYHAITASVFQRKVLKRFTLSNGQEIPKGEQLEIAAVGVNFDETIHENPETFDALRYYKLRQATSVGLTETKVKEPTHNQFVSVGRSSLTFGYGRFACPGRFLAANEIKMIIADLILHFQIKNSGQIDGRYPNLKIGTLVGTPYSQQYPLIDYS